MNEKQMMSLGFSVLLIIVGLMLINKGKPKPVYKPPSSNYGAPAGAGSAQTPASDPMIVPATKFTPGEHCGDVLEKCTAKVEHFSESCDRSEAENEVKRLLEKPLDNIYCEDINERLNASCMTGCAVDLLALVRVPGKVDFEFNGERNHLGLCKAKGSRLVSIRGVCVGK